jgi:hypothetical protein
VQFRLNLAEFEFSSKEWVVAWTRLGVRRTFAGTA